MAFLFVTLFVTYYSKAVAPHDTRCASVTGLASGVGLPRHRDWRPTFASETARMSREDSFGNDLLDLLGMFVLGTPSPLCAHSHISNLLLEHPCGSWLTLLASLS